MLTHDERELLEWAEEENLIETIFDNYEPFINDIYDGECLTVGTDHKGDPIWIDSGSFFDNLRERREAQDEQLAAEQRHHERTHAKGVI